MVLKFWNAIFGASQKCIHLRTFRRSSVLHKWGSNPFSKTVEAKRQYEANKRGTVAFFCKIQSATATI